MMDGIFLLLGTNLGNRLENLKLAIESLKLNNISVLRSSSIYETEAWGNQNQPSFFNQALQISTNLPPEALLKLLKSIEEGLGRVNTGKWNERIIDIDILYYNSSIIDLPKLKVPHPEIPNRRFTLVPLIEIAPDFIHPGLNKNQVQLLEAANDLLNVNKVNL